MPLATRTNAEAFIEADKMRRRVRVHAPPRGFQNSSQKGDCRSLAICAGNVNDRRQLTLRMAERAKKALHAIERQIDTLGVQPHYPRHNGIDLIHDNTAVVTGTHAARQYRYMWHSPTLLSEMAVSWACECKPSFGRLCPAHDKLLGMTSGVCRNGQLLSILLAAGCRRSRQQPAQFGKRGAQLVPMHDHVDHAMLGEIFGTLEAVR